MDRLNFVDAGLLFVVALSAWGATRRGFLQVFAGLAGFAFSLVLALLFTTPLAEWLGEKTDLAQPWTMPAAFLMLWLGSQLVYGGVAQVVLRRSRYQAERSPANRRLAVLPGAVQGLLMGGLLLTLLALAPLPGLPRQEILDSALGGRLVRGMVGLARPLEGVFGPAVRQTLGFLTVRPAPESGETVELNFRVADSTVDKAAGDEMLILVNEARAEAGLPPLAMDPALRALADDYAAELFAGGYFSHTGRDGRSPFDRMRAAGIPYLAAGENLALAPNVDFAHQGLLRSPGHRANILSPQFGRVGIGVRDGGIYGKMFVQEFSD